MKKTITITHDQAINLEAYLLMTTKYRKGEIEEWQKLATEKTPDGNPKFPHAPNNVRYWEEIDREISEICNIISNAPLQTD